MKKDDGIGSDRAALFGDQHLGSTTPDEPRQRTARQPVSGKARCLYFDEPV